MFWLLNETLQKINQLHILLELFIFLTLLVPDQLIVFLLLI